MQHKLVFRATYHNKHVQHVQHTINSAPLWHAPHNIDYLCVQHTMSLCTTYSVFVYNTQCLSVQDTLSMYTVYSVYVAVTCA